MRQGVISSAIVALLALLAGCTAEPSSHPAREVEQTLLTFLVELPSVGRVEGLPVTYAGVSDPLAIKDESRLWSIYVYVFGQDPASNETPVDELTSDDFLLEGAFPFVAPDVSSPAGQTNSGYVTLTDIRIDGGIKHLYFVGNDQVAIADGANETNMINALTLEGRSLPRIDTIPGADGQRQVLPPGIPMSAWIEIDARDMTSVDVPDRVYLRRSVARLDVINATQNYYFVGADIRAAREGYLFDTIPLLQPAGRVWDAPTDYLHATGAWNVVPMPRFYDWVFGVPASYGGYDLQVPPVSLTADDQARPVAVGYMYPTPPRADRAVWATVELQPVDTLRYTDYPAATLPNPNYGKPLQAGQPMLVDVYFEREILGAVQVDSLRRNHVYRVAIIENDGLEVEFIQIEDWKQAQGAPGMYVPRNPSIDFLRDGVSLLEPGTTSYVARYTAAGVVNGTVEVDTRDADATWLTPHLVENACSPIPEWLTLGAHEGQADGSEEATDAVFTNIGTAGAPHWVLDISLEPNTSGRERRYSLYVRAGELVINPSTMLTIIQSAN